VRSGRLNAASAISLNKRARMTTLRLLPHRGSILIVVATAPSVAR
jgi:hypothetical protein